MKTEPDWLMFLRVMERRGRELGWVPSMGTADLLRRVQESERGAHLLFTVDPLFDELIAKLRVMGYWRD